MSHTTLLKLRDVEITQSERGAISFATDDKTAAMFDLAQHIFGLDEKLEQQAAEIERLRNSYAYLVSACSEHRVQELEQERDQLKAVLHRFMDLDADDPDVTTDLWGLQQEEAPNNISLAAHDAEVIERAIPKFIRDMGERITTQDNRITADPLFCVFQKRGVVADEDYDHDYVEWGSSGDGAADSETAEQLDELRGDIDSDHYLDDEIELDGTEYRRVAIKEIDEFVTACFTEQGCKNYLKTNGHNLCKPFIYVTSMYRNEEMKELREWIVSNRASAEEVKS